jgi:hypothetical protein
MADHNFGNAPCASFQKNLQHLAGPEVSDLVTPSRAKNE